MGLFKKIVCDHDYRITEYSNALQQDEMGYPLRLCICKCEKCEKSEQQWIDVGEKALEELDSGKSFLVKWEKV